MLWADGAFLCLGEFGDLCWMDLSPEGMKITAAAKLFHAPQMWTCPVLAATSWPARSGRFGARRSARSVTCGGKTISGSPCNIPPGAALYKQEVGHGRVNGRPPPTAQKPFLRNKAIFGDFLM